MKKTLYTVTALILWADQKDAYNRITYHYETKKDQQKGFNKISADLEKGIKKGTVIDFLIEM